MATRSPSRRFRSLTRSPLTSDPLEELQSRRKYWLPRYSITAWRRDPIASGRTTSFEGSRPIETIVRASAISRREEEVGLMISLAIDARGTYPPRKVWRLVTRTFTFAPCFMPGVNFQDL